MSSVFSDAEGRIQLIWTAVSRLIEASLGILAHSSGGTEAEISRILSSRRRVSVLRDSPPSAGDTCLTTLNVWLLSQKCKSAEEER